VLRDAPAARRFLPVPEGRHAGHDRDAAETEVERELLEVVVEHEEPPVVREQHLDHPRVLARDVAAERGEQARRQLEVARDRVDVPRARDDGADRLARERARELPRDETVDDLNLFDVAPVRPGVEELAGRG
jgi:hypothetical protein